MVTGAVLPPSGEMTIDLPRGNLWVITASFCPGQHPQSSETLFVDLRCHGDRNGDGAITVDDLLEFLDAFTAGDASRADLSRDGQSFDPDRGVDINDLLYFLMQYETGC